MTRWEYAHAPASTVRLAELLRSGWEPFAATTTAKYTTVTIHLRRVAS